MLVILNILALACTAAVMYMCAVHGLFRAGMTLAACVLAGAVAFGLFGPAAGLLGADNPRTVWYYAADALALWAIFCVVFLGLRVLAETLFKNESAFPSLADSLGGGVLGFAAGYLAVGLCLVLVQMLPMPLSILGYSPFQYDGKNNMVTEGDRLWLRWDRGTLALFGYLSGGPLGGEERRVFNRYGNVYPPGAHAAGKPDADDMLYYHWYRRWEYVRWRTRVAQGPLPGEPQEVVEEGAPGQLPGAALKRGHVFRSDDVTIRVVRIDRVDQVANFPDVRLGDQEIFLVLTLDISPTRAVPVSVDTRQFVLMAERGQRFTNPLVHGPARLGRPDPEIEYRAGKPPAETTSRNPRFGIPEDKTRGYYLMDGATFRFTDKSQDERRAFIYTIPADLDDDALRLLLEPAPPAAPPGNPKHSD
ncbi:MAG: CvpA family protein [Phycisphaerae bacterium]